ncbi:MAG: hypothetical protein M3273_00945 [Actinomycetota bacterium]|nr:hypothetical protein [Actinomycetota bacterium]
MSFVVVPNVSEGRDRDVVASLVDVVSRAGTRVLDVHVDPVHNRSVLTVHGEAPSLVDAMSALATAAAETIDLTRHEGVHPRLGSLDVCPFVIDGTIGDHVVALARETGASVWAAAHVPVYLYAEAAERAETRELPAIRAGGLARLAQRSARDLPPDFGEGTIDPRRGVVCVGARGVLLAFNVWLRTDGDTARAVARAARAALAEAGVRALGLEMGAGNAQVSMNLTRPEAAGINRAFATVASLARDAGAEVTATEIVGLPPERFMPDPDAEAARLLIEPGRSLERALAGG